MIKIADRDVVLMFAAIPIVVIVMSIITFGFISPFPNPSKISSAIILLLIIVWIFLLSYLIIRFIIWAVKTLRKR